jgi:hypothetical protein
VRAVVRRTPASFIIVALATVTAGVQTWIFLQIPQPPPMDAPVQWRQLAAVFSLQVPLSIFGAPAWSQNVEANTAIVLGCGALALFAWVSLVPRAKNFYPALAMWIFGAILVAAAEKRIRFDNLGLQDFDMADRYFFIPKVLLLWLLAISIDRRTWRGRIAATALAFSVIASMPVFRFEPMPDLRWKDYSEKLRAGEPVTVPINPDWVAEFPPRPVEQ